MYTPIVLALIYFAAIGLLTLAGCVVFSRD
jgi:hypothetical protein